MTNYNPVTEEVLEELRKAVGAEHVKNDAETLERYKTDEEPDAHYHHLPEVVVAPGSTEEVAAVMKIANKYLTCNSAQCRYQCILRCDSCFRRHCAADGTHEQDY